MIVQLMYGYSRTLFSVNTPDEFVLSTLKLGMLAELGKRKICSFSL